MDLVKRSLCLTFIITVAVLPQICEASEAKVGAANADFALKLLRQLHKKSRGEGVFCSPLSVSTALAMTYGGAAGATKAEMGSVLFGGIEEDSVHEAFADIVTRLNPDSRDFELSTANRLYAQRDLAFKQDFLDLCATAYQSSLARVDFASNTNGVRRQINKWVERKTNSRITELIPSGGLDTLTRLVLVNAIYFKGTWHYQFDEKNTKMADFYPTIDKESKVEMMYQKGKLNYAENADVQLLRLPYEGEGDLAMYIFLPKQRWGLKEWLAKTTAADMAQLMAGTQGWPTVVEVFLPKWKMTTEVEMSHELATMGMPRAFDENRANFSRIADADLYIDKVFHKAFIEEPKILRSWRMIRHSGAALEVSEEGTEAAAATAVVVGTRSYKPPPPPPKVFKADQPFLFLLTAGPHWLFAGIKEQ